MVIKRTYNPLTLSQDYQTFENRGLSPNQFVEQEHIVFIRPVILLVNGLPVLRKCWDIELQKTDTCHFVELPRGGGDGSNPLQMIAMVALIAVAAYTGQWVAAAKWGGTLLGATVQGAIMLGGTFLINSFFAESLPSPAQIADQKQPIDVHNLNSLRNTIRIGQPFVEHFGRFISYPDLVMSPYTKYVDNKQYLFTVGIIGVGEYEIEDIHVGGALIDHFNGINYNIIQPSESPTICPNIVYTNMVGLEISESWLSTIATPPNVEAFLFEFDIVCPAGLHVLNSATGVILSVEVVITLEYREVDSNGDALTAWTGFFTKSYSAATRDPIRHTIEKIVLEGNGRYEFKFKRNSAKSTDPLITDTIYFEAIRAFGPVHPDYGDVTLLEMSLLATEQLNNSMANQISVVCTRKLYPVTATGFGVTKTTTRSIVDACAYIVTTDNGGKQPDSILDFESLHDLGTILDARPNYFDHRFLNRTSAMIACSDIAKCGRAVPYLPGLFSLVRDKLQVIPTQVYTDDDYTENTLTLDHVIRTDDDATCVELQYVDPDTWQSETIQYLELGGSDENPAKLTLTGCTSRQHAYEEAAYLYKSDALIRTNIVFATGLKGHIPKLGDMVYVASRHVNWGQTGVLAHITTTVATLSEPVDFNGAATGKLLLTSKTGGVLGLYTVTPGTTAYTVVISLTDTIVNTINDQPEKATKFVFGETVDELLRMRILKILPSSNNEVRVFGSLIDDDVHDDPGVVPPLVIIHPGDEAIILPDPDPTDGKSYVYGGQIDSSGLYSDFKADCDEYAPDVWTSKSDIPSPARAKLAASTIGSSGYIYGGNREAYIAFQDCDRFTADVWACMSDIPPPARSTHAATTIGSSGYIYGGRKYSPNNNIQDCDQYTPNVWTSLDNISAPARNALAASTIGNNGYIYGGYGTSGLIQDVDKHTPLNTWSAATPMLPPARYYFAAVTIGVNGFVFGGSSGVSLFLSDEYAADIWISRADMFFGRSELAASTIGDSGYVYSGGSGSENYQDCDQYILNNWIAKNPVPLPKRYNLAASTIV